MLRPRIHAPHWLMPRAAKSSSTPCRPPSRPCILRNVGVSKAHWWSSMPFSPMGCSRRWPGPAPYPSTEIENEATRILRHEFLSCCAIRRADHVVEWTRMPPPKRYGRCARSRRRRLPRVGFGAPAVTPRWVESACGSVDRAAGVAGAAASVSASTTTIRWRGRSSAHRHPRRGTRETPPGIPRWWRRSGGCCPRTRTPGL